MRIKLSIFVFILFWILGCVEHDLVVPKITRIEIIGVALNTEFSENVLEYFAEVESDVDSLNLKVEASTKKEVIIMNNNTLAGTAFPIEKKTNTVRVMLKDDDRVYTFTIYRKLSGISRLKEIIVSDGDSILDTININLNDTQYHFDVIRDVVNIGITAMPLDPMATVLVKRADTRIESSAELELGYNQFNVEVIAENGNISLYDLTINREMYAIASLSSVITSDGELIPAFHPDSMNYEIVLPVDIDQLTINYQVEDAFAESIIRFENQVIESGQISLPKGVTHFEIEVIADDRETKKLYVIEITRNPWEYVTAGPFNPRDGAGILYFKGKLWLLGGWQDGNPEFDGLADANDIWSSEDGINWSFVGRPPWSGRHAAGYVVYKNQMWVMSGDGLSDVWTTTDGYNWQVMTYSAPWGKRYSPYVTVYQDKIWLMGGMSWWDEDGNYVPYELPKAFNDVWNTSDGITWTKVTNHAAWAARGLIHGSVVLNSRLYIMGGGIKNGFNTTDVEFNDVWWTTDGKFWHKSIDKAPWRPRTHFSVATFDNKIWVTDGSLQTQANLNNETWYSEDGEKWYELKGTPWAPTHASSLVVFNNELWMVAGFFRNQVWKLNLKDF